MFRGDLILSFLSKSDVWEAGGWKWRIPGRQIANQVEFPVGYRMMLEHRRDREISPDRRGWTDAEYAETA